MENKEKIVVKLEELPPRTEKLSPDELSTIFGGCRKEDDSCNDDCDCCAGSWCPYGTCIVVS